MLIDDKRSALFRALAGGVLGMVGFLLLSWLTQPGSLFGVRLTFDFTFCFNSKVPEALGAVLGFLLWFLFGAEAAIATLPFADGGKTLLLHSLCHFAVMALTLWAWVVLNFTYEPLSSLALTFLLPFTLVYLLIWLGRWVGWYAEVAEIREKLGLSPAPSFLKWKETLPHILFAGFLCFLVPTILRLCDAPDVPVLSGLLYPCLLLPVSGFSSALSLGKRQGFCPLYPLAYVAFSVAFLFFLGRLHFRADPGLLIPIAFGSSLLGNLLGAGMKARREIRP